MGFTTFLDNKLLDQVFGATAYAAPASLYIGLSTTTPAADGTGLTEPTGGAYARVAVTNNATNFPAATAGSKKNGTAVTFPQATASWGTVTYFAIYDAASAGNVIATGALSTSKTISTGDTASFATNSLTTSLT